MPRSAFAGFVHRLERSSMQLKPVTVATQLPLRHQTLAAKRGGSPVDTTGLPFPAGQRRARNLASQSCGQEALSAGRVGRARSQIVPLTTHGEPPPTSREAHMCRALGITPANSERPLCCDVLWQPTNHQTCGVTSNICLSPAGSAKFS